MDNDLMTIENLKMAKSSHYDALPYFLHLYEFFINAFFDA